jgi:hypothetical protein
MISNETKTLIFSDAKLKSVDQSLLLDMYNHLLRQSRALLNDLDKERDLNISLEDQIKELSLAIENINKDNRKQVIALGILTQLII